MACSRHAHLLTLQPSTVLMWRFRTWTRTRLVHPPPFAARRTSLRPTEQQVQQQIQALKVFANILGPNTATVGGQQAAAAAPAPAPAPGMDVSALQHYCLATKLYAPVVVSGVGPAPSTGTTALRSAAEGCTPVSATLGGLPSGHAGHDIGGLED